MTTQRIIIRLSIGNLTLTILPGIARLVQCEGNKPNPCTHVMFKKIKLPIAFSKSYFYPQLVTLGKTKIAHALTVLNPGSFIDLRLMRADPAAGYPEPADITIPFEDYAWRWRPTGV